MRRLALLTLPLPAIMLAACGEPEAEQQAEAAEEAIEAQAEQDLAAAGPEEATLGMTEEQLLDADLVDADGNDLGDVELVERNAMRTVTGLVIELEGSDPERFVTVRLRDLEAVPDGDEMNVRTTLSAGQLAALPDAELGAARGSM